MKFLKIIFKRETAAPMFAMTFASVVCVSLVIARIIYTRKIQYGFLAANLFLAWLPLVFALLACNSIRDGRKARWQFFGLSAAWLLFFPNAPYIFTDLIHLTRGYFTPFWTDVMLILSCAITGLVLGFVSLYLMQAVVTQRYGRAKGWVFIVLMIGLSSIGIYIGRFLRFNSWDVVAQPVKLYQGISSWASDPWANSTTFAFPALFATFLLIAYVMLYALTHLPKVNQFSAANDDEKLRPA